ncbi:hypothetical protein P175DRAFT_0505302 [Aspergillus ochraceoroseus IBT 24754]|uniref:Mitochondrial export translocase Oxa2 n=2 Tax=Aspergillus ochraceoroseus TaxID=138278 RepID=A0A2T5LLJ8_9EURO|nr:uncharacterized protein P175DRAFT_0505302 [Aspergillus ochraceoroseus IBT 24754]KKK25430.1 hypothetical protein AOCH_006704 [Aspergillus ochraceoroseus]PTU17145.1 hypothetical protein P175DRAFT_0505302 [Aspergillus ochraceoroseus IBT 24754]
MRAARVPSQIVAFQQVRRFHRTRPASFISEVLDVSSGFIHGVHSVSGLPWVLSLPLTALLVRMTVAMPLQIYSKVNARKERDLAPILTSWNKHYQTQIREKTKLRPADKPLLQGEAVRLLAKDLKEQRKVLHSRWGVSRFWKPANFLQVPIWISIMESLRAMSGNDKGLVPYLLSLVEPASSSEAGKSLHLAVEPSLATEGALWFPDLLAGDATGILPAALTLSILLNVHLGWKAPKLNSLAELPRLEMAKHLTVRGIRTLIQVLALNIGVSSYLYEMPTALMVYWISSSNIATLQTYLLEKYMFPTPSLKSWRQIYVRFGRPQQKTSPLEN